MNIIGWLLNLPKALKSARQEHQSWQSMEPVRRFVILFEQHGVARTQIPRFLKDFGISLSLADINTDEVLLHKLDESLLEKVCEIFMVRREWLDGVESQIHPFYDFYKHPERLTALIDQLKTNNPDAYIDGVLIAPDKSESNEALLILQEQIGAIGDKPIYRFYLCNNWVYSYWKARTYLTACIAIAWKHHIHVSGIHLPHDQISRLAHGETILGWKGEGIWTLGPYSWHPEEWALDSETYLQGIDPEKNNYGIKSALERWLELDDQGLMNTGLGKNAREGFEERLASLNKSIKAG